MQTPVMLQNTRMLVNFECREGLCDWRWFLNIQSNKQTKKRNPSLIAPVSPFGSNYYYKLVAICFIQKRATFASVVLLNILCVELGGFIHQRSVRGCTSTVDVALTVCFLENMENRTYLKNAHSGLMLALQILILLNTIIHNQKRPQKQNDIFLILYVRSIVTAHR